VTNIKVVTPPLWRSGGRNKIKNAMSVFHRRYRTMSQVTCPTCKGKGTVMRDQGIFYGVKEVKCPNCNGTGKVTSK